MIRHTLLTLKPIARMVAALAVLAAAFTLHAAAPAKPNIIFILVDELGIPGVGSYGGVYKTPNIDALAASGVRFERCFSSPLCAPSRALCMTGRYGFRTGVVDNPHGGRATPKKEIIVAKTLKQAGYKTAVIGKWRQLSYLRTKEDAAAWGFDEFLTWGTGATESNDRYWEPDYNHNGKILKDVKIKYGPDLLHAAILILKLGKANGWGT
jgi:arylsulfatase A